MRETRYTQASLRDGCLALKHQATFKRPYGTQREAPPRSGV